MRSLWHHIRATITHIFAEPADPAAYEWSDLRARCALREDVR